MAGEPGAYRAEQEVSGTIRVWASPADKSLIERLQAGFRRSQPGVVFADSLHGPESTFAGVYTGVADLAFMARELRVPMETMAFEWVHHYKTFQVEVANAGSDASRPAVNLAVFVNADNPVTRLTLPQLDGIFGAEEKSGRSDLRSWGDVEAAPGWEGRPIHIYGPSLDSLAALYIRSHVMGDSRKWNPGYRQVTAGWGAVLASLERDPAGIAFAPSAAGNPHVRQVELAAGTGGAFYSLTRETVASRSYPLTRVVTFALDRPPGEPIDPKVKEFLRYALSREGQEEFARDGAYIALNARDAERQLERLDASVDSPGLPSRYAADRAVSGTIRIWGHGAYDPSQDFIRGLVLAWEEGFQKYQPQVRFDNHLNGTAAAIGALYAGAGDLALMGREIWPPESAAFQEVVGYPPTGVNVVTGSLDVRNRGYAIAIFVHKDNPLSELTLAQLDSIYGIERRRGGRSLRTWGDLGLTGEWQNERIELYGLPIARGFAEYFEDTVFLGSRLWNPALREFADQPGSKGGETDGGQRMVNAMAGNRYAIGYAGLLYHNPDVKALALAQRSSGPFVKPTTASVVNHTYPLTRMITMFLNRAPGKAADPKVAEFLRYVLSREGQETVQRQGRGYLPMLAPFATEELRKLED